MASPAYVIKEVSGEQSFVCVATGDDSVDIKWRKANALADAETDVTYTDLTAVQDDYDTGTGTRTSTLTLSSLTTDDTSDTIECYDGILTDTLELNVVGKRIPTIYSLYNHVLTCNFSAL